MANCYGEEGARPRQRNILWIISLFIAATKTCPISPAIVKSRNMVSRASTSIAGEGSGTSVVCSLPRCRIVMASLAENAARAAGCDISLCSRTCAIIRRKLIPSLEHVTWRDPTVTPARLAISSRLIPAATDSLICSITCGVNLVRLPLTGGLAFVIVTAAPLDVAEVTSAACVCSASLFITCISLLWSSHSRQLNTGQPKARIKFLTISLARIGPVLFNCHKGPCPAFAFKLAKISIILT